MDNHVFPCRVGLRRGLIAPGEIRKRIGTLELGQRLRPTCPVGSVAGNASRFVKALSVLNVVRPLFDDLRKQKSGTSDNNQCRRTENQSYTLHSRKILMKARRASKTIISFPSFCALVLSFRVHLRPLARDPFTDLGRTVLDLSSIGFAESQKSHGFAVHSSTSLRSMAIVFFAAALFDSRVVRVLHRLALGIRLRVASRRFLRIVIWTIHRLADICEIICSCYSDSQKLSAMKFAKRTQHQISWIRDRCLH
jgi:hypothetical protein